MKFAMLRILATIACLAGGSLPVVSFADSEPSCALKEGCVPTAEIALKIGEAVLREVYGDEQIEKQKPLVAKLVDETWVVEGTLDPRKKGGVAEIWISKRNGEILKVTHGE